MVLSCRFLLITLLLVCAFSPGSYAHWWLAAQPVSVTEEVGPIPPALNGAPIFAAELEKSARYLLTQEDILKTGQINQIYREWFGESQTAQAPEAREKAERKRAHADRMLKDVLSRVRVVNYFVENGVPRIESTDFIPTAGLQDYFLLKIKSGEGPEYFLSSEADCHRLAAGGDPLEIRFFLDGTTWVLLNVKNIPVKKTIQFFVLKEDAGKLPPLPAHLYIEAPQTGILKVRFLDEKGQPTPAMARLVVPRTQLVFPPSGFVDLTEQVDVIAIGKPMAGGAHWVNIPGPYNGLYWCVDEEFEMVLPPGEYDLYARHGLEYLPEKMVVKIESDQRSEQLIQFRRWTDMPSLGWYSGDDHIHSRLVSDEDVERMLLWVRAEDVNVANILRMGDHLRVYYEQRGFGPDFIAHHGNHVLVPGQEDPRFIWGHTIGLNLKSMVRDEKNYLLNDWVADTIHEQGGLYGFAHLATNLFEIHRDMTLLVLREKADFGEILQFGTLGTKLYYDFLNLGFQLTATSGTDTPYGSALGENRFYAYIGDQRFHPQTWFESVRAGHTFVTNGPMIELKVNGSIPGDVIQVTDPATPLKITASTWGAEGFHAPVRLQILQHGKLIHQASPEALGSTRIETTFELPAGYGSWIVAQAVGQDGTVAHTSPVYVVREGYRFWNISAVPELLKDRHKSLEAIESHLNALEKQTQEGKVHPMDLSTPLILSNAPQIRERIKIVRGILDQLEKTLVDEKRNRMN